MLFNKAKTYLSSFTTFVLSKRHLLGYSVSLCVCSPAVEGVIFTASVNRHFHTGNGATQLSVLILVIVM